MAVHSIILFGPFWYLKKFMDDLMALIKSFEVQQKTVSTTQPGFTCSKSTMETGEQCVKSV